MSMALQGQMHGMGALPQRRSRICGPNRLKAVVCRGKRLQLPIFPLSMVALPAAEVPLIIFEARYRVLFNTLLHGEPDVEDGLVQRDSPFCGTKQFGMCYVDKQNRLAAIGTVLNISTFANFPDGKLVVNSKGGDRFEIKKVVKEKPVLVCEVELLSDEDPEEDASPEATALAKEVADLLRATIQLNVRMNNISVLDEELEPDDLANLSVRDTSFFVASFFSDIKLLQQNLLEENNTVKRLEREKEILKDTVAHYTATSALKSALEPGTGSGKDDPDNIRSGTPADVIRKLNAAFMAAQGEEDGAKQVDGSAKKEGGEKVEEKKDGQAEEGGGSSPGGESVKDVPDKE